MTDKELLINVESLQNLLVARATGGVEDNDLYCQLREELIAEKKITKLLPTFVASCRNIYQFWNFIKTKFSTYQERRVYIWDEFAPVFTKLERGSLLANQNHELKLDKLDAPHVNEIWQVASARVVTDPEGAITSARTLLESTCKSILDNLGVSYSDDIDLPKLYKACAENLNLAPSQHTEQVFRQILGGCQTVVEGLGAMRNKLGDAHGKGLTNIKPSQRHSELAVNLAGAMATFLVSTWEHNKKKKQSTS